MQPSRFTVRVPLPERNEVFLLNTLTDAQALVSPDVAALLDGRPGTTADDHAAMHELAQHGFAVGSRSDDDRHLAAHFASVRHDRDELRVTVLTTEQCNFACGYCVQGDHGDANAAGRKMSLETADAVARWFAAQLDELAPRRAVLTFFGGEPLLNLPVVYRLAERAHVATRMRGVTFLINVITNGLLLTPDVVDRLLPFGLNGVKVTLDGDREAHDRARPLRGGQGTFDRIIANVAAVASKCRVSIGGNVAPADVASYHALLDFLRQQPFAPAISKVSFKPLIDTAAAPATTRNGAGTLSRVIPLTVAGTSPAQGTCMTAKGSGRASGCDSCGVDDLALDDLRDATKRAGFHTPDGVHMGPCEIHRTHAHTVGIAGELYRCPGFSGEATEVVGHIERSQTVMEQEAARRFDRLAAYELCGDCAFVPVCAGGCAVASHHELGDMHAPTCHRRAFESALVSLAVDVASAVTREEGVA